MNDKQICLWAIDNAHILQFSGVTQNALHKIAQGRTQSRTLEVKAALRELDEQAKRENHQWCEERTCNTPDLSL